MTRIHDMDAVWRKRCGNLNADDYPHEARVLRRLYRTLRTFGDGPATARHKVIMLTLRCDAEVAS